VAGLRLERAAAYKALGLTGSARKEADLVARMPEATDLQRERARALFPRPTHSIQPGPVTAEGALAEGLKLPPEGDGSDWEAAASGLDHPSEVLKHASALYLADGDLPAAFRTAAGSEDDGAIRRVSFHGTWEPLVRVEQGNGVRTLVLDRQGPVAADGPHAQAREVSLGYPWEPSQVLVVREGRRDRLDFVGRKLELDLLCRDELFDRAPAPCEVLVRVDGEETTVSLDDTGRHTLIRELRHGTHRVEVELTGPSALVVHAVVDEDLFAPQLPVTTHATPITTTVAGPSLVRVRVHEGAVRVTVGDRTEVQVTDYVVLPAEGAALVRIESEGTKPALVTLARLRWDEAELEPEPDPWRWVAPPARGQAAKATEHWMALSAQTEGTVGTAPGQQGTLIGRARAGQDPGYRYGSAEAIWLRSLGAQRWIDLSATGRASPDGAPSAGAEFRGTWIPSPWVLSFDAEAFTSGGGGHALAFAQGRYRIDLAPWWRLQPYLGAHAGVYSGRPDRMVDPLAWDPRDDAHPFGLHFGTHLDWRRYRDARVRLTLRAVTEPGPSLDRVGATLLADVLAREMLVVRLEGGVNHSFPQTVPYGAGTVRWSPWGDDAGRRYVVEGRVRASPVDGVTGYVGLAIEASEDRGVLDHSRLDRVFLGALEYPVEER
jgi:hypothetical protein